jgi:hypothetical protein
MVTSEALNGDTHVTPYRNRTLPATRKTMTTKDDDQGPKPIKVFIDEVLKRLDCNKALNRPQDATQEAVATKEPHSGRDALQAKLGGLFA